MGNPNLSRRTYIRTTGAALAGTAVVDGAAADQSEEPNRRIVGTESRRCADRVKRQSDRVVRELDFGDIGCAVVGEFQPETEVELEARSDVRYVESEGDFELLGDAQSVPWGVEEIRATKLHEMGKTGAGAHIAIIDSGIDSDHPDLEANLGTGKAFVSSDESGRREWEDNHNHGTHVAGIADAVANDHGVVGVSTEAILHAVKIATAEGSGDASDFAAGLKWAADQGFDVANMSLGSTSAHEVVRDAVEYAYDKGVLLVAAAGNEDVDEHTVHYPGAYPEVICVGSVDDDGDMSESSLTGEELELVAPGEEIRSCVRDGYEVYSGTSMATAHVSGAAALLVAEGYSKTEVRERLRSSATDLGHDDEEQGYGLVNCEAALEGADDDDGRSNTFAVSTHGATGVEEEAATLTGELVGLGDHSSATIGFEYWVANEKQSTKRSIEGDTRSSPGTFRATVDGLEGDTSYSFTAYAVDGDEKVTGDVHEFTTVGADGADDDSERSIVVETERASDIEEDEAELNGRVTEMVGVSRLKAYFEYWAKGRKDVTRMRMPVDVLDDPDDFDEEAEELESETTYVAVAQCVTEDGTMVSGDPVEFTTRTE